MDCPKTINNPKAFENSQWRIECPHCQKIIGFDGVFNWGWTQGCFGETKITPMDFDGVVERHGHYLVFETKDVGAPIPRGQLITLTNLAKPKDFCVMKIWGKDSPSHFEVMWHGEEKESGSGAEDATAFVKRWYTWADKH